jgi:hypothetical protein
MSTVKATVPAQTLEWLTGEDNPAVAVLTRRMLLDEPESEELAALWGRRNEYRPVARILELLGEDGSWTAPERDYDKYRGSLWQIHFLGELYASGDCHRVQRAAGYAFSRQLGDGSFSSSDGRPSGSIPCLTANVGRALARLGWAEDVRVSAALGYCARQYAELGFIGCRFLAGNNLNGYCHMLAPKLLLFCAEVPQALWPPGTTELKKACVEVLREKSVIRSLPAESADFQASARRVPARERSAFRERYLAEHSPLHYQVRPGWLRFGYPLSYNSDALEALAALAAVGEPMRPEYEEALAAVRRAADGASRWTMRTSFNGKMLADVEEKGQPSKWLTVRALLVLRHFEQSAA